LAAWGIYAATRPAPQTGEAPRPQPPDDKARLQGRWRLVGLEQYGKPVPFDEHVWAYRVEFVGDWSVAYQDGKPFSVKFAVNPAADPKELDALLEGQPPIRHIYRFDGERLVVAEGGPG